jgi:branched-chain amino acid transport system permease protein
MEDFLRLFFIGVGMGSTYGLVGLTLVTVFNATRIINMAQGEFLMLGGILAYGLIRASDVPYGWGALLVIIAVVVVGQAVNGLIVTPLLAQNASAIMTMIGTYAGALLISSITGTLTGYHYVGVPPLLPMTQLKLGFWPIVPQYGLAIIVAVVLSLLYWAFLSWTPTGWALRATGINPDMAKLLGISTARMIALAFIIAAAFGAISGIVVGPLTHVVANMGFPILVKGFVAAVVGGMGNPFAAVVGGVFIGLLQVLIAGYATPGYAELAVFSLLILVLFVRPYGLFAVRE